MEIEDPVWVIPFLFDKYRKAGKEVELYELGGGIKVNICRSDKGDKYTDGVYVGIQRLKDGREEEEINWGSQDKQAITA